MKSNSAIDDASTSTDYHNHCQGTLHHSAPVTQRPISAFHDKFTRVFSYMEEYQQRADRLSAAISINDSRLAREDNKINKGMAQLIWLAAFYIPLNFI